MDDPCGSFTVRQMQSKLRDKGIKGLWQMRRKELCEQIMRLDIKTQSVNTTSKNKSPSTKSPSSSSSSSVTIHRMAKQDEYPNNLYNDSNSCFIDSSLFVLFSLGKRWLDNNIFRDESVLPHKSYPKLHKLTIMIRDELLAIKNASEPTYCTQLRKMFRKFDKLYMKSYNVTIEDFNWIDEQQEPRDVFNMLLRIFEISADIKVSVNGRKEKHFFNAPFAHVGDMYASRHSKEPLNLQKYIPIYYDATTTTYEYANVLCFNVERNYQGKKIHAPFAFTPSIKLQNGNTYDLNAIIMHHGRNDSGHYTCMIKINKKWFHYDDTETEITRIGSGSFQEMLEWENNFVSKNCVLLSFI